MDILTVFLFVLFLSSVSALTFLWFRLVLMDGWRGAILWTLPVRSLNWMTGGRFFDQLDIGALKRWTSPFDIMVVFPRRFGAFHKTKAKQP